MVSHAPELNLEIPPDEWAFLELPENRLARFTVAQWLRSVREGTGAVLYLYGRAGSGKSHLVRELLRQLVLDDPELTVCLQTAADFAADYAAASEQRKVARLRKRWQRIHLWCLEDIQAFSGRTGTLEFLRHVWDEFQNRGGQILITARCLPGEIGGLTPEMLSRFRGSTSVPLRPLSASSRRQLAEHLLQSRGISLPTGWNDPFWKRLAQTPREIAGQVTQIQHLLQHPQSGTARKELSAWLERALPEGPESVRLTVHEISKRVARHFGVTLTELRSASRQQRVVVPRHCAMYLARELTASPLQQIGDYFGNRDHATVLHALQRFELRLVDQADLRQHLERLRQQLGVQ